MTAPAVERGFLAGLGRALGLDTTAALADPYPTPGALYRLLNPAAVDTPALTLIDEHCVALEAGEIDRLAISMPPQEGKLIDDDEPVPTMHGWKRHGDLVVGDLVYHPSGRAIAVTHVHSPGEASLRVSTSDGGSVVVHPRHEWTVYDRAAARWRTMETQQIARRTLKSGGRHVLQLPARGALDGAPGDLPLDPYTLGVWLGDGSTTKPAITHHADDTYVLPYEVASRSVHAATGVVTTYYAGLWADLRAAGVARDKRIPDAYLRAPERDRWDLLCGLIDTDGCVDASGEVFFANANATLARQTAELIRSLGYRVNVGVREPRLSSSGIQGVQRIHILSWTPTDGRIPARLPRKAGKATGSGMARRSAIVAVDPVEPRPGRCITVDSPDGLYLVTEHLLPTHNSSRLSETLPLWMLLRNPDRRIVVASYADELAKRWGRLVRRHIETWDGTDGTTDLGLRIRPESRAADRWELDGHAGGMVTAGVHGGITGRPADAFGIDDPYKDRAAAQSRTIRDGVWDFLTSVAIPRLAPGAPLWIVHTRWSEDDLIGRLQREQPRRWTFLNIAALSEGGADPLGRPSGVWMTSARRRTVPDWEKTRAGVGERDFLALYQGRPNPAVGGLFTRSSFRYWQPTPDPWRVAVPGRVVPVEQGFRFATVDFAASTRSSADYTVCAVWCMALTGELILLDRWRGQEKPELHWDFIRPLVERWRAKLFVEASQYGTDLVYQAGREGWALDKLTADKDKYTRAIPAARRFRQGTVFFPAHAAWLPELVEELAEFPNGRHDDQVDVVAYAHRVVSENWLADPGQTAQDTSPREVSGVPDPGGMPDLDPDRVVF